MQAKVRTVAFQGIDVLPVDVQVLVAPGQLAFAMVGLADKAVGESRERVRASFRALGPGAAAAAHHREPLAGRPRQGRQPLRPADRARPFGRHGRDPARQPGALRRPGRAGARRLALPRAGRAAGGHRRPGGGARRDLPRGVRRRSGLGWLRYRRRRRRWCRAAADHRRTVAAGADQPPARPAGPAAAAGAGRRGSRELSRPRRDQGPGERQAGARAGGGRRPQSPDDRPARLGQIDAGGAAARHPAAARARRGAGSLDGAFAGGRAGRGQALPPAHLPRPAPFGDPAGAGRRRPARPAGRGLARPSRRAVPRRAAGIQSRHARGAAPAAGVGPRDGGARQRPCHLSGALPARGGDEPLPLRPSDGAQPRLRPRARAAASTIRASCRARCSTASIWRSTCRR